MDKIECIKKSYENISTGRLQEFLGCTIKCYLTKTALNIFQPHLITKITQVLNEYIKQLMKFNTPTNRHRGLHVINKQTQKHRTINRRDTGAAQVHYYTLLSINYPNDLTRYMRSLNIWMNQTLVTKRKSYVQ